MIKHKRLVIDATAKWRWRAVEAVSRRRILMAPIARRDLHRGEKHFEKGHFVVYTSDKRRFVVPLKCLESEVFKELFRMSEEEFGLPSNGPITLPCSSVFMEYVMSFVRGRKELERALLVYMSNGRRCSSASSIIDQEDQNRASTSPWLLINYK